MKILLITLLLVLASTASLSDTQCRKSAAGEVTCQSVDDDSALDSETTDQPVPNVPSSGNDDEPTSEHEPGGQVGDKTSQTREPGITY